MREEILHPEKMMSRGEEICFYTISFNVSEFSLLNILVVPVYMFIKISPPNQISFLKQVEQKKAELPLSFGQPQIPCQQEKY